MDDGKKVEWPDDIKPEHIAIVLNRMYRKIQSQAVRVADLERAVSAAQRRVAFVHWLLVATIFAGCVLLWAVRNSVAD